MSLAYALLVLLVGYPADAPAEVHTLTGKSIQGEVTSLNAKEIVVQGALGEEKIPIDEVLDVVLGKPSPPAKDTKYILVELVDGTQLNCAKAELKNKQVKLTLLGGQEFTTELGLVKYLFQDAQDADMLKQWRETVLTQKHTMDVVGAVLKGQLNPLDGTLGEVDDKGQSIGFTGADGTTTLRVTLSKVRGLYFVRGPAENAAPLLCKVYDTHGDVLMASEITRQGDHYGLKTSLGITVDYPSTALARLDYNKGKLVYLSDLKPIKVQHTTTEGYPFHYRTDLNLDGKPLMMGGKPYSKGLAVHARTELEYDLGGEYRELKMDVGFDYQVGGSDGPVVVVIQGDGKELRSLTLDRASNREPMREVTVNIKDVNRLKLIVRSGTLLDLGKHVNFGNAQVSK